MKYNSMFSKYNTVLSLVLLVLILMISSTMAQQVEPEDAATPAAAAAEAVTENADTQEVAVELDPGMQIPLDGSSLEAFNESLETVKANAKENNYTSLEGAISYLLVYDLGAGRDKAKLAKNLNGLTGDQIIAKVEWRQ